MGVGGDSGLGFFIGRVNLSQSALDFFFFVRLNFLVSLLSSLTSNCFLT